MTRKRWTRIARFVAIAGGAAWLGKIAAIAEYGGLGGPLEGPLFVIGALLMLVAATGVSTALPLRSRALFVVGVIAAPIVALLLIGLLEPLGASLFAGLLPAAAGGEGGILLVAVLALLVGAGSLLRPVRRAAVASDG